MSITEQAAAAVEHAANMAESTATVHQTDPTYDYVIQKLRNCPEEINASQKKLDILGYAIAATTEMLRQVEVEAAREAAADKTNKNADMRKAAADDQLLADTAYQETRRTLHRMHQDRDEIRADLQLASNFLSAAKAEAYLLAALLGS